MKLIAALTVATPIMLLAYASGPDPRLTGAPGDETCASCHSGTLNSGAGSVKIRAAAGTNYTPGVKQRIQVEVADAAQRRWGFQFSARLASDLKNAQAGTLTPVDKNTQVICDNGDPAPCKSATVVQFILHTEAGTRNGTTGSAVFEFDWTPPETDLGKVTFYAAGNAANGNNQNSGDRIYTTTLELTPAAAPARPSINTTKGVVNAAHPDAGVTAKSWITINGANLATTTRTWTAEEIAEGARPTTLDKVGVTVNGKAAAVQYISPAQINVLTPDDDALGPVEVKVTANGQTSDAATVTLVAFAPALFAIDDKYLATTTADRADLTKSGKFFSGPEHQTAVKAGDKVTLFGTGMGPGKDDGTLVNAPVVTVGGVDAPVVSAGLVAGSPQIYQVSITLPQVADGDQPVIVQVGGVNSPTGYLAVQK
jgi:uncharacterized protein (TIGR03437 family)